MIWCVELKLSCSLLLTLEIEWQVTGLSSSVNYYHLYCLAEDTSGHLSDSLRMLPVTLDHRNNYRATGTSGVVNMVNTV